jgi:hypothetical protein
METEIPASVNRVHRHFIVDDEVVISRAAPAPPMPSTPPNQAIASSLESTFMRTFGRFGQARIRSPSLTRREATESEALQEAEMEARRIRSRRRTSPAQSVSTAQAAPVLTPQEVEDSSELSQLDPSTPLIDIPLQSLGVLVKYRPTRIFQPRNVARNIKRIMHKIVLQLQALQERRQLKSNEALQLFKKIFLVHFVCLGYHKDKRSTPFTVSTDILENDDWTKYKVGSFCERRVHAEVLNAGQREELRMKRCGNLIKQGFVSKAVKCLQEKALPIPKNVVNKNRLKDLHPQTDTRWATCARMVRLPTLS